MKVEKDMNFVDFYVLPLRLREGSVVSIRNIFKREGGFVNFVAGWIQHTIFPSDVLCWSRSIRIHDQITFSAYGVFNSLFVNCKYTFFYKNSVFIARG